MANGYGNSGSPPPLPAGTGPAAPSPPSGVPTLPPGTGPAPRGPISEVGSGFASEVAQFSSGEAATIYGVDSSFINLSPKIFVNAFEAMVEESFPNPEILRVDFSPVMQGVPSKVTVKVKVSGDFLDDEWFWADFLKYFKLKVFLIEDLANYDKTFNFYESSLFNTVDLGLKYFNYKTKNSTTNIEGIPVPALDNKSNKLANQYILNSSLEIKIDPLADTTTYGIVARTYFDHEQFQKELLDNEKIDFYPLKDNNNGRWDLVEFESESGVITRIDKIYAEFLDSPTERWNGAFGTPDGVTFYASSNVSQTQSPFQSAPPIIIFNRRKFENTNVHLSLAYMMMMQFINTQKEITKTDLNSDGEFKFKEVPNLSNVFSKLKFSKQSMTHRSKLFLYFSFDYLELFKQLSIVPAAVYDNLETKYVSDFTRHIRALDTRAGKFKDGFYKYRLGIRVVDRIDQFIYGVVEELTGALTWLKQFMRQAMLSSSTNSQTGEFTKEFIDSGANGTSFGLFNAVEVFYNVLESNLLSNFLIEKLKLQRIRIKNDINTAEFDKSTFYDDVLQIKENTSMTFDEKMNEFFYEFSKPDLRLKTDLLVSREELLESFRIENMNIDKALDFQTVLELFQKQLLSLVREDKAPQLIINAPTGWSTDSNTLSEDYYEFKEIYDAKRYRSGYNFPVPEDIMKESVISLDAFEFPNQKSINNPPIDQYLLNNIEDLDDINKIAPLNSNTTLSDVYLNNLSLNQGFDFNFVGQITEILDHNSHHDEKSIEILDLEDQKFMIRCSEDAELVQIQKPATQSLFEALSSGQKEGPKAQIEYLAGFDRSKRGKLIMKSPIWVPSSDLTENHRGKELLFRVRKIESGRELSIYNEYFLKKV